MRTRLQFCQTLWYNALRRESKGRSSLVIGFITSVSAIIYCMQWHVAALISVTSALANACRLIKQIVTRDYKMYVLFCLSLLVIPESSKTTLHKQIFTLFDICVTVHHWFNDINEQLDATMKVY